MTWLHRKDTIYVQHAKHVTLKLTVTFEDMWLCFPSRLLTKKGVRITNQANGRQLFRVGWPSSAPCMPSILMRTCVRKRIPSWLIHPIMQQEKVPCRKPGNLVEPFSAKSKRHQSEEKSSTKKEVLLHYSPQAIYDYCKHSGWVQTFLSYRMVFTKFHFSAKNYLKGLMSVDERSILVCFHCIVPQLHWQWDETSCIHMRFEGDALGNWKHNVGDFMQAR